jgi:hypothetical protein
MQHPAPRVAFAQGHMFKKVREPIILMFLCWHFAGVMLWDSPDCSLRTELIGPFVGYLNFFGLWQGWSVFEKPRTYNGYLTATITFKDGTKRTWEFPRMEKMNLVEKMFKEKFRRWTNDCVSDENLSFLWPDTTRYIARLNHTGHSNPKSIAIIRHWTWIEPPEKGISRPLRETDDGQDTLYTGYISDADLK